MGEHKANIRYNLGTMARRPDIRRDDVLSEKDLKEVQRCLALLSSQHVEDLYRETHRACCLQEGRLPQRAIPPRTRPGVETDEEVEVIFWDSGHKVEWKVANRGSQI
jgi:hypothetical protein